MFRAGEEHKHFFLVVSGEIDATRTDPALERRYFRGEPVAGPAVFAEDAGAWEARARTDARLLAIPIEAWYDLMEEHFDLGRSTLLAFALRRELILDRLANEAGPDGLVLT